MEAILGHIDYLYSEVQGVCDKENPKYDYIVIDKACVAQNSLPPNMKTVYKKKGLKFKIFP